MSHGHKQLNVAIFGWYHHKNEGDDRIQYVLTKLFDGDTLAFLPSSRACPVSLLRTYDLIILGGGGIIMDRGGMFKHMKWWMRWANKPVMMMGVSVEALPASLAKELQKVKGKMSFISVRDHASKLALGIGEVGPDLTWMFPFEERPIKKEGIALCLRKSGGFPLEAWKKEIAAYQGEAWPLYFERGGDQTMMDWFATSPSTFSLAPLEHTDIVVTNRYHAIQFALQVGRPFVAIGNLPKITHFLREVHLAHWQVEETEPKRIHEVIKKVREEVKENPSLLPLMRKKLIDDAQHLRTRIEEEIAKIRCI